MEDNHSTYPTPDFKTVLTGLASSFFSLKEFEILQPTFHNWKTWPLPFHLTIKVFSMLDMQSLCHAAAACTMFYECSFDPLCFVDVDLTSTMPNITDHSVTKVIERAGEVIWSLRIGLIPRPRALQSSSERMSILTSSCLNSLTNGSYAPGSLLRKLHLYNIDTMDNPTLCVALSACPSLNYLEIVGL